MRIEQIQKISNYTQNSYITFCGGIFQVTQTNMLNGHKEEDMYSLI